MNHHDQYNRFERTLSDWGFGFAQVIQFDDALVDVYINRSFDKCKFHLYVNRNLEFICKAFINGTDFVVKEWHDLDSLLSNNEMVRIQKRRRAQKQRGL